MVRIMAGQGFLITGTPPCPLGTSFPISSTMAAVMPGKGSVHEPGTSGVAPGSGVIMWPPVSVCHQVSTIGQRPPPMLAWYHSPAADVGVVPLPRRRVDRFAHRAQQAQRGQVIVLRMGGGRGLGRLDQRAD